MKFFKKIFTLALIAVMALSFANTTLKAEEVVDFAVYTGQTKAGDGQIETSKIKDYVAERYGYTFVEAYNPMTSSYGGQSQYNTSYYINVTTNATGTTSGTSYSEGNCALNTMYQLLKYWSAKKYITTTTSTTNVYTNISKDSLYSKYGVGTVKSKTENGKTVYYKWTTNSQTKLKSMPTLYVKVRNYAVSTYSYTPESGFNVKNAAATMKYVANTVYGNSLDLSSVTTSNTNVIANIKNGIPSYMSINGSSTYENHAVSVVGYAKFSYKSGIFNTTKYAYFYEIADNWGTTTCYFDPNTSASPTVKFIYMK